MIQAARDASPNRSSSAREIPAISLMRAPVNRVKRRASPVLRIAGGSTILDQNRRISSSDSTRRPTLSTPRFLSLWQGLASARSASIAKVNTLLIRDCTRFAKVGVPSVTRPSTSSITSFLLISAKRLPAHLGRMCLRRFLSSPSLLRFRRRECSSRYRSANAPNVPADPGALAARFSSTGFLPSATARRMSSALCRAAVNATSGYRPMVARVCLPVRVRKRKDQLLPPSSAIRSTSPTQRRSEISVRPAPAGFADRTKTSVRALCTSGLVLCPQRPSLEPLGGPGARRGHRRGRMLLNTPEHSGTEPL